MDSVVLTRPVRIVVIMTPAFRQRFIEEARAQIAALEENLQRLESSGAPEVARQQDVDPRQADLIRQQIDAERARLMRRRGEIEWHIKEVEAVPDGAELPYRTYEGPVTLAPDDDFLARMSEAEVVLRDWKVVAIRTAGDAAKS